MEGRICFVFYSHLKNVKEVYVTTALDREAQAVRGQVRRGRDGGRAPGCPDTRRSSEPCLISQVSFYRGSVPTEVPEEAEAARQRKGADALWMATLPLKLPVRPGAGRGPGGTGCGVALGAHCTLSLPQRLRAPKGRGQGASLSLAPLNLGDAENGFLTQANLLSVAGRLGPDWPTVALHLGLPYRELQRIRHAFR